MAGTLLDALLSEAPLPPPAVEPVTTNGVLAGVATLGIIGMWFAAGLAMENEHWPDIASEVVLPALLALGSVWTLSRLRYGGSRFWLVPALTFLLAWSFVGIAWADHVEDPDAEEDCDQSGFLPAAVEPAMWAWATVAIATSVITLFMGIGMLFSPGTRQAGQWCMLAVAIVISCAGAVGTRCM